MSFLKEKKIEVILFLTFILGFILRVINVNTKVLLGDPPHFAIEAINFFDSGLLVIWDQSTYLWYAFTNMFYYLFGVTQFATRFSSLLFGTLSILALYLFVKQFSKNKNLALISAVIFAFAPGIIIQTADEQDMSVLFFIIMAFYSLIYALQNNSKKYLYISAIIFGVASMWKAYLAILLIPYIGIFVYYKYKEKLEFKKYYKTLLVLLAIILLLVTPTLVYNYLNYKHNGVVDFLFATAPLGIENEKMTSLYGWTLGNELNKGGNRFTRTLFDQQPNNPDNNTSGIYIGITESLLSSGKILWSLALIGFIFMFIRRNKDNFAKDYLVFFSLYFFIPFLYMIDANYLNKHYIHFLTFAIPMISYLIINTYHYLSEKFPFLNKLKENNYAYVIFGLYVLFVFFVSMSLVTSRISSFYSENPEKDLISYKAENIEKNSLIIYDDRIYNSQAGWLFSDRYYIPASFLNKFMEYNNQSTAKKNVAVYIVECATDDCGWGTVKDNPSLNKSMEDFFDSIKKQNIQDVLTVKSKVTGVNYYNPLINGKKEGPDHYIIYKTNMQIDLNLASQVKMQYEYFLYPTEYLNKNTPTFKQFTFVPEGAFEKAINDFAWIIFYLNIVLSLLIILFFIYEFYIYF